MQQTGRNIILGICIYLPAKALLNLFLGGFGTGNLVNLIVQVAFAAVLLCRIARGRWIVGAALLLIAALHLTDNLRGLPATGIYLAEAVLDVGAAAVLFGSKDVKTYMNSGEK